MKQYLNFGWHFVPRFEESFLTRLPEDALTVDIPHTHQMLPLNYFDENAYQFVSTYELIFDAEDALSGKLAFLHFEGLMVSADVYLNGQALGHFVSAYLPFQVRVTDCLKPKGNRLVVVVDAHENPEIPPFGGQMDYITYGGIYREVTLVTKPQTYIEALRVTADHTGHLKVHADIAGDIVCRQDLTYVLTGKGKQIAVFSAPEYTIEGVHPWSLKNPDLYELTAVLVTPHGTDRKSVRFGCRSARFTAQGFYLNGERIKLVGLNRHQAYPYVGYAMPQSIQEMDADILKYQMGVSIVRSSHYPPSQHFLNRCDEIGLLVFDEIPGWQHIGASAAWREQMLVFLDKMVRRDFNHPCVVIEGVRINESPDDHALYETSNRLFHALDPNRQSGGVRNFKKSELLEDVYTYNDFYHYGPNPGLENPRHVLPRRAPYLITEFNGHMYPTKSVDNEDMRVTQAFRHLNVLESVFRYPEVSGGIGWCFADYNTHRDFGSGDHICYHGVTDMFRIPKYAAGVYASQQDDFPYFKVLSSMNIGEHPEALLGETIVLTNADYVEFYKNDRFIKAFYPDHKHFPHLPHPPVRIDDYIGDQVLSHEKFSKHDASVIKEGLRQASVLGFAHLPKKTMVRVGLQMVKNRLSYDDLVRLWNLYVANWGQKSVEYRFKAYKNKQLIADKTIGPSLSFHWEVTADKNVLQSGVTYDATRVVVKLVDQYGETAQYTTAAIDVTVSRGLIILGPTIVSLTGGSTGLFVRTENGYHGSATLTIKSADYGSAEISLDVQ